ncbi:UNVERIFIED_CONTAM: multidrug efflux pump subunit AcrB [Acetivibrio alkalicellulosi]
MEHKNSENKNHNYNLNDIPELSIKKNFFGNWTRFFVDRFRVTILIIIIMVFWGLGNAMSIQRESEPKVTIPMAIINATYTGASPEEVEILITNPIEKKIEEIDEVTRVYSYSGFGYSTIQVEFETGADIIEKIRETKEKMSEMKHLLPDGVETPFVSDVKTGDNPVVVFSLTGDDDIIALQDAAAKIKDKILLVDGVSEVEFVGDVNREVLISVDPQKLATYNLSLDHIRNAVASGNINFPGGDIELNDTYYNIRTVGQFTDIKDIENTILSYTDRGQIYLKDIAVIKDRYRPEHILVRRFSPNDDNILSNEKAIAISVRKTQMSDDIKVRDNILKIIEENKDSLYPDHYKLEVYSDKAKDVEEQLGSLVSSAISGLCLVIVVLFIFIGFRESVIVSTVIPLSLMVSLGLMNRSGMSLNMVSMFSLLLAVGMLVDNAIVAMENIDRLRLKGLSPADAAKTATNQIAPAVFSATLTTIAAFFPIALTTGMMGDYIRSLPYTVIFTLTASFFVAITITPSICSILLKKHSEKSDSNSKIKSIGKYTSVITVFTLVLISFIDWNKDGFERITLLSIVMSILFGAGMAVKQFRKKKSEEHSIITKYITILNWLLNRTYRKILFLSSVFFIFLVSLGLIFSGIIKVEMFGNEDFPTFYVSIETPSGSTLEQTKEIQTIVENNLLELEEIKSFVSFVGHSGVDMYSFGPVSADVGTPNNGRIIVELFDAKDRERTSMEVASEVRQRVKEIPGAQIRVQEIEMAGGFGAPVYIMVLGESLEDMENTARDFEGILASLEGVTGIRTSMGVPAPEIQIIVDKNKAASVGLDNLSIALSIRNALHGIEASKYRVNQDEYNIIIKTDEGEFNSVHDIEKINFYSPTGSVIPFTQIASKVEGESNRTILHRDGKRYISVTSGVEGNYTASEVLGMFNDAIKDYNYPEGVTIQIGGEMEQLEESFEEMMMNMVIALILVFIILTIQFNSMAQPFIILLTVPLSLIGVIAGLFITGNNFGFLSFVGVVALVGIAVNDAIVLIDYINYLRKIGYDMKEAIVKTGVTRFIPVFATTITTAGGILPITLSDPFFAPLGVTLIAGLCMATVLTLVIVPTVYSIVEGTKFKFRSVKEVKSYS